jgi:ABC-type sugar transport system permease subunit
MKPAGLAREARWGYGLLAPALAIILLVALYPLGYTLWLSFQQQVIKCPWLAQGWVGLANYRELLTSLRFWQALGNTFAFTLVSVSLELVLGLAAALVIYQAGRLTGLVRAGVLLPWAIPEVVAAVMWLFLVNPAFGLIPMGLRHLGLGENAVVLLARPWTAWATIIATDVWKTTPFMALLLLAGLQTIPADLYEAAALDGASPWQSFRRITLPLLKPAILVALIFRTAQSFMIFGNIYTLTAGGPGTATETMAFLTYQAILNNMRFGYGSALSVMMFLGSLAFALLYLRTLGLKPPEGEMP